MTIFARIQTLLAEDSNHLDSQPERAPGQIEPVTRTEVAMVAICLLGLLGLSVDYAIHGHWTQIFFPLASGALLVYMAQVRRRDSAEATRAKDAGSGTPTETVL